MRRDNPHLYLNPDGSTQEWPDNSRGLCAACRYLDRTREAPGETTPVGAMALVTLLVAGLVYCYGPALLAFACRLWDAGP